jgi:YrbI family 3-deoxy-D-manno-octulosonate 8-phosphate phosphatase
MAVEAWVIIPARGGSKGIPSKNLQKIQGRSLVARAVVAARGAQHVGRVLVSTDDDAIATEARLAGAEIIERPTIISGDTASSESAVLHALDVAGEPQPDIIVLLQCTSPFVRADDIDGTIARLIDSGADTAHTVAISHAFLWHGGEDAGGVNHDKRVRPRRQDREVEYLETGAVYAMRTAGFCAAKHRFFGRTVLYEMPALRAIEIDTPDDLAAARLLAPLADPPVIPALPNPLAGIVFDFDGVMTDDRVLVNEDGRESVWCNRADGLGIEMLKARGVRMGVISRETNTVVAQRCAKLGVICIQATTDKPAALRALCDQWNTVPDRIVFVGNDITDNDCIALAGLGVAVADAHASTRAAAGLVLTRTGGHGAIRELCDLVLAALTC